MNMINKKFNRDEIRYGKLPKSTVRADINTQFFPATQLRQATVLKKPINTDVAKPCEKRKLSQGNKEQKVVVPAGIIISNLCEEDSLHRLHQEDSHA